MKVTWFWIEPDEYQHQHAQFPFWFPNLYQHSSLAPAVTLSWIVKRHGGWRERSAVALGEGDHVRRAREGGAAAIAADGRAAQGWASREPRQSSRTEHAFAGGQFRWSVRRSVVPSVGRVFIVSILLGQILVPAFFVSAIKKKNQKSFVVYFFIRGLIENSFCRAFWSRGYSPLLILSWLYP